MENNNIPTHTHTIRKGSIGIITETIITETFIGKKPVMEINTFEEKGERRDYFGHHQMEIVKDGGPGFRFLIKKTNGKRLNEMSVQLGADQLDMLVEFIKKHRSDLGEFNGEFKIVK